MDNNKKRSGDFKQEDHSHFKMPQGYFEEFESRLSERMAREREVSILDDPLLRSLPFRMPKDYLDSFEVNSSRHLPKKTATKVVRLMNFSVAIAASFILFFGIKQVLNHQPSESTSSAMIEELDLELWFEDQESLHAYDIAEVLEIDEINSEFVSTDALEDHLEINQIDYILLDP